MPLDDILSILPEIILAAAGVLILAVDPFLKRRSVAPTLAALACLASGAAAVLCALEGPGFRLQGTFRSDEFLLLVRVAVAGSGLLLAGLSHRFLRVGKLPRCEYFALFLFALSGVGIMAGAVDLILLFIGLEILSLASCVLAAFRREHPESAESGVKYFFIGSLSAAIMLYGIAWIYGSAGGTRYTAVLDVLSACHSFREVPFGLLLGLLLVSAGLFFKLAVVPFHVWAPDVYQGAPSPVSAFLASVPKIAGFAALLRIALYATPPGGAFVTPLLAAASVLTMLVGNLAALRQENLKRLLAYSSIAHAGYILLGLLTASGPAYSAVLFYLVVYAVMTIGAFAAVTVLAGEEDSRVKLDDYQGIGFTRPFLGSTLAICLLSLAGIPATAGFIGKLYLFSAALEKGWYVPVLVAILASLIGAWYYLRVIVFMFTRQRPDDAVEPSLTAGTAAVLAACGAVSVGLGVYPGQLLELTTRIGSGLIAGH